jgi:DNA polymerase III alpha subunit (gram-positive type)
MHAEQYLHCPTCADVRLAEAPPCADGHGYDCPERACTDCGTALFVDPLITREQLRPAARRAA